MSGNRTAGRSFAPLRNSRLFDRLAAVLVRWFQVSARDLPWRHTSDPYAIWVSEVMLQQTQVKTVIPFWERWMRAVPNVQALAKARSQTLHKLWEGLGYYTRVRNMQRAARIIVGEHRGEFPKRLEEVIKLPGIGRYTAGALCSIAFNQPTPVLDGNVIRVLTRLFGISGNPRDRETNEALWGLVECLVGAAHGLASAPACSQLNQALMELGAVLCKPREPECSKCPVQGECVAYREQCVLYIPNLPKRPAAIARHFRAFVVESKGKYFVRQRPAGVVNGGLWEFPAVEETQRRSLRDAAIAALGFAPSELRPLLSLVHSITRYRNRLQVFAVRAAKTKPTGPGRWVTLCRLEELPFPSAHRKIVMALRPCSPQGDAPRKPCRSRDKPTASRRTRRDRHRSNETLLRHSLRKGGR